MSFDLSEFRDVDLDLKYSGSWPQSVKMVAIALVFVLTLFACYFFVISDLLDDLDRGSEQESKLRYEYENKHRLAFNLGAYQEQMIQMEVQLAQMLKKLPATHETPGLLDDITFIATSAGLKITLIKWGDEVEKEFYTELPLHIDVTGDYHQFGKFVSEVAKLPRIVSLHEFAIVKEKQAGIQIESLDFNVVAKTYRYKGQ
ncbi:type 4a pilus biogenesis protein PilO [Psychrobium sp. 1_MG-2023]|uniref:type 4a pilus biogenesis protein PilO n=1 Tax=Psychrobium sp. 1_MG-2023 TaxID=3062624 RepID=UPI000C32DAB0|nr:type 4a pilus biogenesis protein PilO [Psychrobium sp. 1_MG-2023]MDP2560997.1 type 4a pilus biogenesis protein PilO [Psychrobium sp. 1_MG-2023]PKF58291.1 pilus assembly protein PilP [Alteromonadales bacterium alter-6D02]